MPSGSELYYSFDYGDIHFVCLDSYGSAIDNTAGAPQFQWLAQDLAANTKTWVIAFWHHPPYSYTSAHHADNERDLVRMRENAVELLENAGVDLVLAGHNHHYDRTQFINGHYGSSATFNPSIHVVQAGDGSATPYSKNDNRGATYVMTGSAGKNNTYSLIDKPVTQIAFDRLGSFIIETNAANTELTMRMLRDVGSIDDTFRIVKQPAANSAPTADAGPDGSVQIPAAFTLNGAVSDDNFPGNPLNVGWSQVAGPANGATFANAGSDVTTVTFATDGVYTLRLTADDGEFSDFDTTVITVTPPPANQAPVVSAGTDQTITLPGNAALNGTVSDDGLPVGANVTTTWSQVSGPGTASFANASAANTSASFTVAGTYVLRLTASDTELSASDEQTVTVNPEPPNAPPTVDAGADRNATIGVALNLNGSVSDDGRPNPPGAVTVSWTQITGPGAATFSDASLAGTDVTLSEAGDYVLRLTADDGAASSSDDVVITATVGPAVFEAEGFETGFGNWSNVSGGDSHDWTRDSGGTPSSSTGPSSGNSGSTWYAYLETSNSGGGAFNAGDTAILEGPSIASGNNRSLTFFYHMYGSNIGTLNVDVQAGGVWTEGVWTLSGQQQTGNAAAYSQATVDLSSFTGAIRVRFRAVAAGDFRGDIAIDDIEISGIAGPPVNQAPIVNAGADQTVILPDAASLTGSVSDDGLPPGVSVTASWSHVSGPGTVSFGNASAASTTVSVSTAGVYVLRLTGDDTLLSSSDDIEVTFLAAGSTPVVIEAEDFEVGLGNWANVSVGDSHDWTRDSGGTPSSSTGPSSGNSGSTWYAYLETSINGGGAFSAGDTAILEGPSITSGNSRSLTFFYHMYGSNIGTLNVDVQAGGVWTEGVWTLSGQQQTGNAAAYSQATVDLSSFTGVIRVRFRAVAAGDFRGDIAIDDIEISGIEGPIGNQAPVVSAGADQTIALPSQATLNGSVTDDGLPTGSTVTSSWSQVSGPGVVTFANPAVASTNASFPDAGSYVLRLSASDTELSSSADVTITVDPEPVNQAPVVSAGADQTIALPSQATLNGSVTDDGLPTGSTVTSSWSQVSGPGVVTFANPAVASTNASFPDAGSYVLRLSASDTELSSSADVTITVDPEPVNQAPVVSVGADQTIALPSQATLNGSVADDGLPTGSTVTSSWSQVSGPGVVTFANPAVASTSASFSDAGSYVLRLSASDTELGGSADVTITVNPQPPINQAPVVDAGADQSVELPNSAALTGAVTDDGLPSATTTANWSQVSGPGVVTFADPAVAITTASFSAAGSYVLRLTGDDGALSNFDEVTVTVSNPPGTEITLEENTSGGDKQEVKDGQNGAQSFSHPGSSYSVTRVTLYLSKKGGGAEPDGPLLFSIGTSVNGGTIAGSDVSISASQVTNTSEGTSFDTVDVAFASPLNLTGGTTYYMNFKESAPNGEAYFLEYAGSSTYANGSYFKSGSNDGKDIRFTIRGSE